VKSSEGLRYVSGCSNCKVECVSWCSRSLHAEDEACTIDHLQPPAAGGPREVPNILISCARCNHFREYLPPADWLLVCQFRGRQANREVVVGALEELASQEGDLGNWGRRQLRRLGRITTT
jgi:hypothetical protein